MRMSNIAATANAGDSYLGKSEDDVHNYSKAQYSTCKCTHELHSTFSEQCETMFPQPVQASLRVDSAPLNLPVIQHTTASITGSPGLPIIVIIDDSCAVNADEVLRGLTVNTANSQPTTVNSSKTQQRQLECVNDSAKTTEIEVALRKTSVHQRKLPSVKSKGCKTDREFGKPQASRQSEDCNLTQQGCVDAESRNVLPNQTMQTNAIRENDTSVHYYPCHSASNPITDQQFKCITRLLNQGKPRQCMRAEQSTDSEGADDMYKPLIRKSYSHPENLNHATSDYGNKMDSLPMKRGRRSDHSSNGYIPNSRKKGYSNGCVQRPTGEFCWESLAALKGERNGYGNHSFSGSLSSGIHRTHTPACSDFPNVNISDTNQSGEGISFLNALDDADKFDESLWKTKPKQELKFRDHMINFIHASDNKLTKKLFGSKNALLKEKRRQMATNNWIIHPCSNFR